MDDKGLILPVQMFESHGEPWEESRIELAVTGGGVTFLAALGSLVVYEAANQQCLGGPTMSVDNALTGRNGVCEALGLPLAPGAGSHALLLALFILPVLVATLGTVAALASRSFRPISIAGVLSAVAGLGLIVLAGNASVSDRVIDGP